MDSSTFGALSLALGLGLLIGLQRQRAGSHFGGIRTFPFIAMLGAVCGLLAELWGGSVVFAGFLGVAAIAVLANIRKLQRGSSGFTSEAAALLTFAVGVLVTTSYQPVGIVVGGLVAVLLHLKRSMHAFAGRITDKDLQAVMRFAIVSLIVLPLLPDAVYGPYEVLNPREIWWMVVLIVGIGLAGYVSFRLFGGRAGVVLGGILGGLVSSTATTVAYARRVREHADAASLAAITIMIASTIAVARVLVEVAVAAGGAVPVIAPPLVVLLILMVAICVVMVRFLHNGDAQMPEQTNPAELKSALIFGAVYALVIFVTAAAEDYFGAQALYAVAFISGFVDVDAITLSTSRLAAGARMDPATAWRVILTASLTNLLFKTAAAWALGSSRLMARLLLPVGVSLAGGIALLLLWPSGSPPGS